MHLHEVRKGLKRKEQCVCTAQSLRHVLRNMKEDLDQVSCTTRSSSGFYLSFFLGFLLRLLRDLPQYVFANIPSRVYVTAVSDVEGRASNQEPPLENLYDCGRFWKSWLPVG